jgi:hypothetical protein
MAQLAAATPPLQRTAAPASHQSTVNISSGGQDVPFAQQFNYHLQDLAIVRRTTVIRPDGKVRVHLPGYNTVMVEYNRRETIERFRDRLQSQAPECRIHDYYIVSPHGAIEDQMTLDEYFLTPGTDLLLIRKGVGSRQQLINRKYWLKSHDAHMTGKPRPCSVLRHPATRRRHNITPYREAQEESALPRLSR